MSILPGTKAPWFASVGFQENKFLDISITDFTSAGKWLILFFTPSTSATSPPASSWSWRREELEKLNCRLLGTCSIPRLVAVSQDSAVVHERFAGINRGFGGVFGIKLGKLVGKIAHFTKDTFF